MEWVYGKDERQMALTKNESDYGEIATAEGSMDSDR